MSWLLKGEPKEVQTLALTAGYGKPGYAYFLEMGLGKTAVTLAEIEQLRRADLIDGAIVVCPPSLKENWAEEIEKWGLQDVRCSVWPKHNVSDDFDINILNYESLSSGSQAGKDFIQTTCLKQRIYLVLDESTQIKNNQSKRTKSLLGLSKYASFKRILSGLPMVQGPQDIWAQLKFLGALKGVNFYAFRNRYCRMGGWMGKQVVGPKNESGLSSLLQEWSFRATKDEWTDLPPKLPPVIRKVELSKIESKHYKEMEKDFVTWVKGTESVEAPQVITKLLKLQQISSGFINDEMGNPVPLVDMPSKAKELQMVLEESSGKVLVFCHFNYSVTLLRDVLAKQYNPALMVSKAMQKEFGVTMQEEKKKFEHDSSCRVFIVQTTTGKYGHTLLGGPGPDRCKNVVFYENSYSLDDRVQAEDRPHRHGQDQPVSYTDLVCSPTDKKAIVALQRKFGVADTIINSYKEMR